MELEKNEGIVEAILFVSGTPVEIKDIGKVLEKDEVSTREIIENLSKKYEKENRGLKIIEVNNSFQLCTKRDYFKYIKKLYEVPSKKVLSQPMLETLSIIAYKQPVTKSEIQDIRGINSDHAVNMLIKYGLVEEKGRLNVAGKPILLGTSEEFLKHFNFQKTIDFHKLLENTKILEDIEMEMDMK